MDIKFQLQLDEESQLEKMCSRLRKKQNRNHIVEDMIEIRKARKQALLDKRKYYAYQKVPAKRSKLSRWYEQSTLRQHINDVFYKIKKKIFSYESVYLHWYYGLLDIVDKIRVKKRQIVILGSVILFALSANFAYNFFFGCEVIFNGYNIGVVNDMSAFYDAVDNLEMELADWYDNPNVCFEQTISVRTVFIRDRSQLLDTQQCESKILTCKLPLFTTGGIIYIDGVETVRLSSVEEANRAIEEVTQLYVNGQQDAEVLEVIESDIAQNITVEEKLISLGSAYSYENAVNYLLSLSSGDTTTAYTVASADASSFAGAPASANLTATSVVTSDDSPTALEQALTTNNGNQGLITALSFRSNDYSLTAITSKPVLSITSVREVKFKENIDFGVTYQDDPDAYIGTTSEVSAGVYGTKEVTAIITYVNGKETQREVLSETVISEPVNQVVSRGTKILPPAVSTGTFVIPATGLITDLDRPGSSHAGSCAVDIANSTGTPIYASDSGVITMTEWYGSYGNCIIIQHEGNYSTLYGHLDGYNVSVGQQVSQGDVIGYMGNTGYSTGTHLHFEIRYNNVRQYLPGYFSYLAEGVYVTALQ